MCLRINNLSLCVEEEVHCFFVCNNKMSGERKIKLTNKVIKDMIGLGFKIDPKAPSISESDWSRYLQLKKDEENKLMESAIKENASKKSEEPTPVPPLLGNVVNGMFPDAPPEFKNVMDDFMKGAFQNVMKQAESIVNTAKDGGSPQTFMQSLDMQSIMKEFTDKMKVSSNQMMQDLGKKIEDSHLDGMKTGIENMVSDTLQWGQVKTDESQEGQNGSIPFGINGKINPAALLDQIKKLDYTRLLGNIGSLIMKKKLLNISPEVKTQQKEDASRPADVGTIVHALFNKKMMGMLNFLLSKLPPNWNSQRKTYEKAKIQLIEQNDEDPTLPLRMYNEFTKDFLDILSAPTDENIAKFEKELPRIFLLQFLDFKTVWPLFKEKPAWIKELWGIFKEMNDLVGISKMMVGETMDFLARTCKDVSQMNPHDMNMEKLVDNITTKMFEDDELLQWITTNVVSNPEQYLSFLDPSTKEMFSKITELEKKEKTNMFDVI